MATEYSTEGSLEWERHHMDTKTKECCERCKSKGKLGVCLQPNFCNCHNPQQSVSWVSNEDLDKAIALVPKESKEWEKEFDKEYNISGSALFEDLKSFITTLLKAERERAYNQGHFDGHDQGLTDGMEAGEKVAYSEIESVIKVQMANYWASGKNIVEALNDLLSKLQEKKNSI